MCKEEESLGERTLSICSPCWPKNLKEMSPCIWKACADHLSVLDLLIGMLSITRRSPFCCRSHLFTVLHIVLEVAVYAEYTWEVFPYCWELEFHLLLLLLPYLLLAGNIGCFVLCSRADPGKLMPIVGKWNQKLLPTPMLLLLTLVFVFHRYNNKTKSCITDEDLCV